MTTKVNFIFLLIVLVTLSCGTVLAGGVGPPPQPLQVPLDGGASAMLLAAGAYIGYRALKKNGEKK
jgi:hypothetical protein